MGVAELVGEGEVQGWNGGLALLWGVGGLWSVCDFRLLGHLDGGGGLGIRARQGPGQGVHPPGDHEKADDHQQHPAHLHGVAHHVAVLLEQLQKSPGKQSHRQEGQDKAQGVQADEGEALEGGVCRARHEQHAGQGGTHAGGPGKGEGEAEHQSYQRAHGQLLQGEADAPVLLQGHGAKDPQLEETKGDDENATHLNDDLLILVQGLTQSGHAKRQQEEGGGNADDKEQGVHQGFHP